MAALDWLQRLTPFDRKLLIVVAVIVAISFLVPLYQTAGTRVVVSSGGRVVFVAPLDKNQRVEINGPLGVTVLQIDNGAARIISSPCSQKICIRMGKAQHTGDLIACVPNRIVVRIEGRNNGEDPGYDLISR